MTLRPIAARWFELVTVHKELARTMECLSRTGAVQLEARSGRTEPLVFPDIEEQLKAFHELARRYQSHWPPAAPTDKRPAERLSDVLGSARQRLAAWADQADPVIAALERLLRTADDLDRLSDALAHVGGEFPNLARLVSCGPRLRARLIEVPLGTTLRELPPLVLVKQWDSSSTTFLLAVGGAADIDEIEGQLPGLKGRLVPLPAWLPSSVEAALGKVAQRRADMVRDLEVHRERLAELSVELRIASALGDIALIEWFNQHAKDLRGSQRLAWVTGWTSDLSGARLRRALEAEGIRHILRLAEAPVGATAPMVLVNPSWARGFETFARMLGTPARNESDPSLILFVIVPVIFGFMFGDVGQGLVVFVAGLTLGRRIPLLRMLVPGGIMAIAFGLLFGSVFSREDVIEALWLRPLADPITILAVALGAGAVILLIGMLLDAVQAHWRAEALRWWRCRAGLPAAYVGVLLAPFQPSGLILAAIGATWYIFGSIVFAEQGRLTAIVRGLAEFVEEGLRLLVNTLSFARVGAFALAHAGLSVAIVEVAEATGPIGYWIVLALGNVLVIALEGLVVGIQTTRLMLFEFFIRFLTAGGREFKPLPPPEIAKPTLPKQSLGSTS
jgi:V/A-type H+-transporting ATPase subunit I